LLETFTISSDCRFHTLMFLTEKKPAVVKRGVGRLLIEMSVRYKLYHHFHHHAVSNGNTALTSAACWYTLWRHRLIDSVDDCRPVDLTTSSVDDISPVDLHADSAFGFGFAISKRHQQRNKMFSWREASCQLDVKSRLVPYNLHKWMLLVPAAASNATADGRYHNLLHNVNKVSVIGLNWVICADSLNICLVNNFVTLSM